MIIPVTKFPYKSEHPNGTEHREAMTVRRDGTLSERVSPVLVRKANIVDHPIAQHALTVLRDDTSSSKQVRYSSHQLLMVLTIEALRGVPTRDVAVEAARGTHIGKELDRPIVFVSLSRHSLGLSHNIADLIPGVSIGSVTLESGPGQRHEARLHLANAPALNESRIILFDPVVGAGLSAGSALSLLQRSGATDVALISFVVSAVGLKRVQSTAPDTSIWTAAIDEDFDPKIGPVPGIGKFGERLYSTANAGVK